IVRPDPGPTEFGSIQAAVDAAPSGATVLVEDGIYLENLTLGARSVAVVAAGENSVVRGSVTVDAVSFDDSVLLDGLSVVNAPLGVTVRNSVGTVWLEELEVVIRSVPQSFGQALVIDLCDAVVVTGGLYTGSQSTTGFGVLAASIRDASATLYDVRLESVSPSPKLGVQPPPGLDVEGSIVFIGNSTIAGADATPTLLGPGNICDLGLAGGAGIQARDGQFIASDVTILSTDVVPGAEGQGPDGCPVAVAGQQAVTSLKSTIDPIPLLLPPRQHEVNSLVDAGEELTLRFEGTPGEVVFTTLGIVPEPLFEPIVKGTFGAFNTTFITLTGELDAEGQLLQTAEIPIPLTLPAARIFTQGLFFSVEDAFVLTPPRSVTLLATPDRP
ncbi:MAG: hypothetical protein AAFZ65_01855, partial [Planctomycetota bacterium]